MTERVRHFRDFLPAYFPLPHPSWRSTIWMRRNPWFEEEVLPDLRARVAKLLGCDPLSLWPEAGETSRAKAVSREELVAFHPDRGQVPRSKSLDHLPLRRKPTKGTAF